MPTQGVLRPAPAALLLSGPLGARVARCGCGLGWHRVRGYRDYWGRWVRAHCAPNW